MQENAIYTAVIRKKSIILSEYTDYSGNFEQIIKKLMKIISEKNIEINIYKATIFISKHKVFILKNTDIFSLLISDIKEEEENTNDYVFCFLYSIITKLNKLYKPEELQQAKSFSLIDFRNVLEKSMKNFRSNIQYYKEYLNIISSYATENSLNTLQIELKLSIHSIVQVHKEHPKEYDALEINSNLSTTLNGLSESLINSSTYEYNTKSKCCKFTIIIIIIILLLALGIIAFLKFYLHKF